MGIKMRNLLTKHKEQVLYLIFGGITSVISIAVYEIFIRLGFTSEIANTVSTAAAVATAYITNKIFVFETKGLPLRSLLKEMLTFASGRLFTFLLETGLLVFFVDYKKFDSLTCKLCTTALIIVLNYVISKKLVFKKH